LFICFYKAIIIGLLRKCNSYLFKVKMNNENRNKSETVESNYKPNIYPRLSSHDCLQGSNKSSNNLTRYHIQKSNNSIDSSNDNSTNSCQSMNTTLYSSSTDTSNHQQHQQQRQSKNIEIYSSLSEILPNDDGEVETQTMPIPQIPLLSQKMIGFKYTTTNDLHYDINTTRNSTPRIPQRYYKNTMNKETKTTIYNYTNIKH
jgi:hypothetical protein